MTATSVALSRYYHSSTVRIMLINQDESGLAIFETCHQKPQILLKRSKTTPKFIMGAA
jgi:hypothetical protein